MRRPVIALATLAFAAILGGCGSDAKEDAQAVATGEALAQAPPNAVGVDIPRPAPAAPTATSTRIGPGIKIKPKASAEPEIPEMPEVPVPPANGETPKKGTDL